MEIIDKLLENGDFGEVLKLYGLHRYELLDIIYHYMFEIDEVTHKFARSIDEMTDLKKLYTDNAIMYKLNAEKVMLISDTHLECKGTERLDYFEYVADFCQRQQIHYLIHGGDITDGTAPKLSKPIYFSPNGNKESRKQMENILKKYPDIPGVTQLALGGNHDEWYLSLKDGIDILRVLADYKGIFPLGFTQAFITICDIPISLEHFDNRNITKGYIPHDLAIKGHSHEWRVDENNLYLPTLSKRLCHPNTYEGKAGFVIMQPIQTNDGVILHFDRYTFIGANNFLSASKTAEKAYTLTRKKEM